MNTGVISAAGNLDADLEGTAAVIAAEERQARDNSRLHQEAKSRGRLVKLTVLVALVLIGLTLVLLRHNSLSHQSVENAADASDRFPTTPIPLAGLNTNSSALHVQNSQSLSINGQLNVNNSLVIAPTTRPNGAVTGQLYYDQTTNQLSYFNGSSFQTLVSGAQPTIPTPTTIGGVGGAISVGGGLNVSGSTLSNTGVLTLQGESGNVTLAAGPGIVINGTTLSSSGVLSLGGLNGDIAVGSGLSTSGGNLHNSGIISAVGAGTITVTNDGNGNIVIDGPNGSGGGTVASPGGTIGKIAKFTGVQTIADSLLSDDGTTVTVSGNLDVTGALTLNAPLTVAQGGTGAANAAGARTNLGAAASGANNDITQLTGLTTALSVAQGGTGIGVLPANGVLIGNGAGAISGVTSGAAGQCLISTAGAPSFQTCPGTGGVTSLNGLNGVITLQGVSGGSLTSGSGTITINDATSAIKGLASFNSTNLTVINGNVNTVQNIGTTANPTFAGLTLTGALTVANGGTGLNTLAASELLFAGSTSTISQLANGTSGQCLVSNGAGVAPSFQTCTGAGGVASLDTLTGALTISNTTGAGSTITINNAKADGATKGIAAFNGTNFKDNGSGLINTIQDIASTASPTFNGLTLSNALSVANGGTGLASLVADELIFASTSGTIGQISAGTAGQCLTSGGAGVAPSWQNCPGAGGGGVTSLNGLSGVIVLDNASGAAGHITIANAAADGTTKGIAAFNGTNFKDNGSGLINTIQDIAVTSAPTFGQLTVTSGQATGDMLVINNTNVGATGNLLNLELGGSSKLSVAANGNLTSGLVNGQTISSSANFTGSLTVGSTLTVNTISPTSSMSIGVGGQAFTLQGNASSVITSTDGTHTIAVGFQAPSANATYTFPDNVAGSYDICTTQGNCAGSGGGVTTSGGTANTLAKFTSGNAIGNSIITDNGSTVTIGGTLAVNTITPSSALTVGATGQNLTLQGAGVSLKANAAGITNSLTFAVPSGSNKTITLPNASGTVAVSASGPLSLDSTGNLTCPTCLTGGGGGGSGVSSVNGATGALTLQGSDAASFTTLGTTITVNDASSTVKGLAKFNSTDLTVTSGSVDTIQGISTSSSPQFAGLTLTSALTVANGGTGATTLTSNGVVIGHGTSALTAVTGTNGQCLEMSAGAPAFVTCPGAGGGGVSTVNGLSGALTINNVTTDGISTITINNAKADGGTTKGIASFNSTNFSDNGSGVINTIQSINSTATPTFGGLTLNTALGVSSGGTGLSTLTANQLLFANSISTISQLANGTSGQCLVSNGAGSAPSFQTCTGAGGVSSINALTGAVTIDYATGAAGHVTIQDAKADNGTTKGVASFNSTNFSATSGVVNTIQGIATTSTPTFAGLTLTSPLGVSSGGTGLGTLTAFGILYASSTSAVSQLGVGTSGQCLISNGAGVAPSFQTCTGAGGVASLNSQTGAVTLDNASGSGGHVTIQNAAADGLTKGIATFNTTDLRDNGSGLIDTIQGIATTSTPQFAGLTLTSALTVGNGGTGLSSLTANELLYAASSSSVSQLGNGTSGQCLISNGAGVAPSFQTCTGAGGVSSVNGLTGSITIDNATGAAGHITIANAKADNGTTKGIASFNSTNFSDNGSGVINTIQGIATSSTPTFAGLTLTSPLTVGSGGTGLSTLTAHGLLYASSTSAVSQLPLGTSGQCLISNGAATDPSWQSCPGGSSISGSGTSGKLALFNGSTSITSSDVTDTVGSNISIGSGVSLTVQGSALFKPASNSPTAFQVQNATGGSVFNVDTVSGIVGTAATAVASTNSTALVLQSGNATGATSTAGNVTLDTGTSTTGSASISIGTANAGTINIGSTGSTAKGTAIHIGDTTSTTSAQTVTIGSAAANTGNVTTIQGGSNTTAAIVIAPAIAGGITIGNAAGTGTIALGNSTASNTINIGNAVTATGNTQTINIGAGNDAGTGKAIVTVGNSRNASMTTIQGGTGGLWINTGSGTSSGSIVIQSGDVTGGSNAAGNVSIDTGNSLASGSTSVAAYSFEDGTIQVFNVSNGFGATLSNVTTGLAQDGGHVLAATESAGNGGFWGVGQSHTAPSTFAASPGLQYKFSAWIRAVSLAQTISGQVAWENASNGTISTISLSTVTDTTTGWVQMTGSAVAPAGTAGGAFFFSNSGDGNSSSVTYFDNITVLAQGGAPALLLGSSNAQSINIGSGNQSWATTIQNGSGDIDLNTGSGVISLATGVGSAGVKIQTNSNTATAFQVQNAGGFDVLTANTSTNQVIVGASGHVNGSLAFADSADNDTITFSTSTGGVLTTTATGDGTGSFGAPSSGTYSTLSTTTLNNINCSLFTFGSRQNATATSMTVTTTVGASATSKSYDLAIYTGNGNQPTTKVASATGTLSTTAGANTLSISASLTAGTQYWLCANTQNSTVRWAAAFTEQIHAPLWTVSQTYGTWPSTISAGTGTTGAQVLDITLSYTSAGTGSTVATTSGTGQVTIQGTNNNGSAFQVQDTAGENILSVSTGGSTASGVTINNGGLNLSGLTNPTGVSFSLGGTGGTVPSGQPIDYYVDAVDAQGNHTQATDSSNSWQTPTSGQKATITWNAVPGAVSYTVYYSRNFSFTYFSHSVPAGTTSLVDDGTIFSAAVTANNQADPSIYSNQTSGVNLQNGMGINLDGNGGNVHINYTQYNQLLLDNATSGGKITLQATNFDYNDENSGTTVFHVDGTGASGLPGSAAAVLEIGKNGSNRSIAASGSINANGLDYAEYFYQKVPGELQPGDVACVTINNEAEPCNGDSNSSLLGVVSTDPGMVGGGIYDDAHPENTAIIAMVGQVPVKVSDANGAIHVGDMLTFDPATGLAVKATGAGMTIGQALQDFSGATGTINLYIHIGYYDPMGLQSDGVSNGYVIQNGDATLSNLTLSGTATINTLNANTATIGTLTVNVALSTADITINGHIVTGGGTPTVAAGTTAGTGASLAVTGTDTSGKLTITVGTGVAAGDLVDLTFHTPYSAAPNVTITAGDSNAAQIQQYVTPTTTGFSLNAATAANLTAGQTYTFYYHVLQ